MSDSSFLPFPDDCNYATILAELRGCKQKIVSLETEDTSLNIQLLRLDQHFNELLEIIHVKMQCPPIQDFAFNQQLQRSPTKTRPQLQQHNSEEELVETLTSPCVTGLDDVIGLHDVKKELRSLFLLPRTQPQLFENRSRCNSVLFYGPPGTGKTRLAHALAAETAAAFRSVSAGDLLSRYVGMSERTIKSLFATLTSTAHLTVLFIDELDGLCRRRSADEPDHIRRIKNEFMCQLNTVERTDNLFVIGATNCPWDIDSAILRRFHRRMYIALPSLVERAAFFAASGDVALQPDHCRQLAQLTGGYSGSDLRQLIDRARNYALVELHDTHLWQCTVDGRYVPYTAPTLPGDERSSAQLRCSELADLPPNTVIARQCQPGDYYRAAQETRPTVKGDDECRYQQYEVEK